MRSQRRIPVAMQRVWMWSVIAFVLTLIVGYAKYRLGTRLYFCNPLTSDRYEDLTEFTELYQTVHTQAFFDGMDGSRVSYPPLGAVVYAVLYATRHPVGFYQTTAALWLAAGVWGVRRRLIALHVGIGIGIGGWAATLFPLSLTLISFPILGLLQQGNIELYLWIFAALGTWAFLRGRDNAAAVLWALAAAMKLYPVVLLMLLLPRRKWRAFAVGVATFVGTTLASLAWLGPTIHTAWQGSLRNVFGYQGESFADWSLHEMTANHSVFNMAKLLGARAGLQPGRLPMIYYACGAVVIGVAFFGRLWKMPVANQLLAVSAFMLMLPPISYFYTLVNLYPPFIVLLLMTLRAERSRVKVTGLQGTLLLFVPLFTCFTLFTYPQVLLFGGLIHACLLIALFVCALLFPFAEPADLPEATALPEAEEVGTLRVECL